MNDLHSGPQTAGIGKYDHLYASRDLLWPAEPGRMVRLAQQVRNPGKCLDMGCGDGKNLVFLEEKGWIVDGVDVSTLAIQKAADRAKRIGLSLKGSLFCGDVSKMDFGICQYDLVLTYGLYHCLDYEMLLRTHTSASKSLKDKGLMAFCAFTKDISVPEFHNTGSLFLRSKEELLSLFENYQIIKTEFGVIVEDHLPLVPVHEHSVLWGLFRKGG
jgi:SAM-dependent methyltransferase